MMSVKCAFRNVNRIEDAHQGTLGRWNEHSLRDMIDSPGGAMTGDMTRQNVVQEKSYAFALSIVKIARSLRSEQKEWVLSKQLIRSGTSIGANIEEAIAAQSKRDFLSKMCIALKEAREPHSTLEP